MPAALAARVPAGAADGSWARRIFLAVVVAQSLLVATGGLVRLTSSGLGCPTWPQCAPGSFVPVAHQAQGFHKDIEFGNRLLTFVLAVVVLAAIAAAVAQRPRRPVLVRLALLQLLGIVAQAVLGGITVLTHLNPASVAGHFLLSMLLIAAAVVLHERSGQGDGPPVPLVRREVRWLGVALVVAAFAVVTVGTVVTGSGPHAGDLAARRFGFDPAAVSVLHADLVWLFSGLTVAVLLALRLVDAPRPARTRARWLAAVVVAQGVIGYVQYFTGLPTPLVDLHMLGACLVVIAAVSLWLSLRARPEVVRAPGVGRQRSVVDPAPARV